MNIEAAGSNHSIVLFDGVCNLCNNSVQFIIKRDSKNRYRFAPIQSPLGLKLLKNCSADFLGNDSFALIENGRLYSQTDAALRIARHLDGFWFLFGIFRIIPPVIRDIFYRLLGRNRYRLFGRRESCMIPTGKLRLRFLSDDIGSTIKEEINEQAGS